MAALGLFCDSFDHYGTLDLPAKWNAAVPGGNSIQTTPGTPRTGRGCLQIGSAFGPSRLFPSATTHPLAGGAVWVDSAPFAPALTNLIWFVGTADNSQQVRVVYGQDLSVSVLNGNDPIFAVLGSSGPGVIQLNAYNYVEVEALIATLGSVIVRVNGVEVLNLTNVRTVFPTSVPAVNLWQLLGPGNSNLARWDDVYLSDWAGEPSGVNFRGAVRVYAVAPDADLAPLEWTPLIGPANYPEVAEIPPDGDTSYVFSTIVGNQDQYSYNASAVPVGSQIQAVQDVIDAEVAAGGSASLAPIFEGVTQADFPLPGDYAMFLTFWDENPATAAAWQAADFPAAIGQEQTA